MTEKDTIEKRSVSGMQTDFHLLYPPDYDRNKAVPMKDYKFIQALKIDAMVILIKDERVIIRTKLEKPSKIKGLALI